jgi:signal transduction histidine kinase
VINKKEENFFP